MKNLFKLMAVLAAFIPMSAHAQVTPPCYNTSTTRVIGSGCTLSTTSGSTVALAGAVDTSGITSSTLLTGNPLEQVRTVRLTTTQINNPSDVLASASGRTIYPRAGFSLMASGAATGGLNIYLKCSGGALLATIPVAELADAAFVTPLTSARYTPQPLALGTSMVTGCPINQSVMISADVGNLTVMTHLFLNLPYTVQ